MVTTTVKYLERILPCSLTGGVKARTSCVPGSTFRSPAKINKPEGLPGVCPILPSVHPALEDEDESATIKGDTYTVVAHKLLKFLHVIQVLTPEDSYTTVAPSNGRSRGGSMGSMELPFEELPSHMLSKCVQT